jgi:general nucleoside transport system ATP-binding protein
LRLEIRHLSKSFGGFKANDAISLHVGAGEIHALLGENGAGKSTLVKMIYGLLQPDSGQMFFEGQSLHPKNPVDARKNGIAMVFQHFSLFEDLTVYENILLGVDEARDLKPRLATLLSNYALPLDLDAKVHTLSVGEKQRIEIMRALLQNPRLLIMDEPTSVLTPQEVEKLFETLRRLAQSGCSILYISHKLHEIMALCDKATILRNGKVVASLMPQAASQKELAELMLGGELAALSPHSATTQAPLLIHPAFTLHRGQILGVAGIAGNGQDELLAVLSGESRAPFPLFFKGEEISHVSIGKRREKGLLCLPEERNGHAAVGEMTLVENTLLSARERQKLTPKGWINQAKTKAFAAKIIHAFDVRTPSVESLTHSLSGGNIQKFIVGREILQTPDVFIVCQPTWGVDAGAAQAIRQALIALSQKGAGVMVISQDLDELFALCDTLSVINQGVLSPPKPIKDYSLAQIGLLMGGLHGENV